MAGSHAHSLTPSRLLAARNVGLWLVVAVGGLAFGFSAFLDPEPHHDGVQIAPAIAVAEGLHIHRDVFDHYGPITAWLHAAGIWLFEPRLLVIRIITALLLLGSAVLMYLLARKFLPSIPIAVLLTLTWIATWPGRSVDAVTYLFLPWPSITVLILQLAVMAVLVKMICSDKWSLLWPMILGIFVTLGALTRLNTGIPIAAAVVLSLVFAVQIAGERRARMWRAFMISALVVAAAFLTVLILQGSVGAYLQDAILGPLAGEATDGTTSWFFYENVVLLGSLPVLLAIGTAYVIGRIRPNWRRGAVFLAVVGTLGLTLWASTSIPDTPIRVVILQRLSWAPALDHQAFQPLYALIVLLPVSALVVGISTWRAISTESKQRAKFRVRTRATSAHVRLSVVLTLVALTSIVQFYPFIDPNHVWWAAPLPMILVLATLLQGLHRNWAISLTSIALIPPLAIAIPRAISYVAEPRERLTTGVLEGMYIPEERLDDVEAVDLLMKDLTPGVNRFNCWNGLFAVWTGRYLADDSAFVNWAPGFDPSRPLAPGGVLVDCADSPDTGSAEQVLPQGLRILREGQPVSISYYNVMTPRILGE